MLPKETGTSRARQEGPREAMMQWLGELESANIAEACPRNQQKNTNLLSTRWGSQTVGKRAEEHWEASGHEGWGQSEDWKLPRSEPGGDYILKMSVKIYFLKASGLQRTRPLSHGSSSQQNRQRRYRAGGKSPPGPAWIPAAQERFQFRSSQCKEGCLSPGLLFNINSLMNYIYI